NWKLYSDQKTARKFGRVIALETDGSQEIAKGMPIEYQGVKVGEITLVVPNFRRNMVEVTARIRPEYVENIAVEGSHFWLT
ncbi:MCE family protein, partial [Escherichia coli]|nr:MCE family protein [Escherichia coli]